jgi:hypothetical protein
LLARLLPPAYYAFRCTDAITAFCSAMNYKRCLEYLNVLGIAFPGRAEYSEASPSESSNRACAAWGNLVDARSGANSVESMAVGPWLGANKVPRRAGHLYGVMVPTIIFISFC